MSSPLRIKVCGLVRAADAAVAREAGADYLGLILAPSPRRIDAAGAEALVRAVPAAWVGVFVDPAPAEAADLAERLDLAAIQLHGDETPAACRTVRETAGRPVWKALRWTGDAAPIEAFADAVDLILLDSGAGGGRRLPWKDVATGLAGTPRNVPLFVAGGLDADGVGEAIAAIGPDGVDASSRLERSPGVKDPERVRAFVRAARAAAGAAVR